MNCRWPRVRSEPLFPPCRFFVKAFEVESFAEIQDLEREYDMLPAGGTVLCAVSGGADLHVPAPPGRPAGGRAGLLRSPRPL